MSEKEKRMTDSSEEDERLACWLSLAAACIYLLMAPGHFSAADDEQKYLALEAMLRHGTVLFPTGWSPGVGGNCSFYPLGGSVLMFPGALLGWLLAAWFPAVPSEYVARFFISLQNAFFTAALLGLTFAFARRLGLARKASLLGTFALGFGTMLAPYAKTSWSEPGSTFFVYLALLLLWRLTNPFRFSAGLGLASGASLAFACLVRLELVLLVPGALLWLTWHFRRQASDLIRLLLCLAAPMVLMLALTLTYNTMRFGSPWVFSNWQTVQSVIEMPAGRLVWALGNLWHYTFNLGDGMVWYSPALLLGLLGWRILMRRRPTLQGLLLLAFVPLFIFYVAAWGLSDWAWGLRYSYIFQPALMLGACALNWSSGLQRWLQGGILSLAFLVQLFALPHNFGYLLERERAEHPGLSVQALMATPQHAPLWRAARDWGPTLEGGLELWRSPAPTVMPDLAVLRRRSQFVPDFWPFLLMLTPLPRSVILLPVVAIVLILLGAIHAMCRLWRRGM